MTRKLLALCLVVLCSTWLAGCERPAPGTPLPTVTPALRATVAPTVTPVPSWTPTVFVPPIATAAATSTASPTAIVIAAKPTASPTATAITAEPTATPAKPTPGLWPSRPAALREYVPTIIEFLNANPVHIVRLRPMLADWGVITEPSDGIQEADLNNDGQLEFILVLVDPTAQAITIPGELAVIERTGDKYHAIYQASADTGGPLGNIALLATRDINADGKAELAYTTMSCGAHTCFTSVYILAWDGSAFKSLTTDEVMMPYAQVTLEKRDEDPALELVLHGGMIGSVGAGPQRARTEIFDWNGTHYVHAKTLFDESDFLYFKVLDANTALLTGDYTRAIALYREAISNEKLRVWKEGADGGKQEREDLTAFARFRLVLTYVLVRDEAKAEAMLEELQKEQPDHVYNQVAQVFWDYYTKKQSVTEACKAVTDFARENPKTTEALSGFGYANPSFAPDEVCPIGLGTAGP